MRWVVRLLTMVITNDFLSNDNGTLKNDTHTLKFELWTYKEVPFLETKIDLDISVTDASGNTQFGFNRAIRERDFYDEFYRIYCDCCKKLNLQPMPQEIEQYYDELNDFFD